MGLVYRPDHPQCNENGLVDRSLIYYEKGSAPYVISDEMPETRHMADNRMFTSKAKYRANTRAHGCVEVGTETAALIKPRKQAKMSNPRDAIRRALWEVRNGQGYKPERGD